MNILDEMLSSYIRKDFKHSNCRVCNRKLTDPVSIYLGVGPECSKKLHDWLDIRMPEVTISSELHYDSDFEYENGAVYADIHIESICPWTEQTLHQTVIRLENEEWDLTKVTMLERLTDSFMDGVIDGIAYEIRYDYHRSSAEGWDMLSALFEDLQNWDQWPEIAKQVAIVDTGYVMTSIEAELGYLGEEDELFSNTTVHVCEFEGKPSYEDLESAPVNLFTYDIQDDDGSYSVNEIKGIMRRERPRALLWIFADMG
ncbi:DUF6011 domain-containing protein [Candidatus Marinimicrobia bacterium]|nr:DUF6011 domain-containing protein [Candidatus Neomarinimicrobiota bacterium]